MRLLAGMLAALLLVSGSSIAATNGGDTPAVAPACANGLYEPALTEEAYARGGELVMHLTYDLAQTFVDEYLVPTGFGVADVQTVQAWVFAGYDVGFIVLFDSGGCYLTEIKGTPEQIRNVVAHFNASRPSV